jgi:hypothetical protein
VPERYEENQRHDYRRQGQTEDLPASGTRAAVFVFPGLTWALWLCHLVITVHILHRDVSRVYARFEAKEKRGRAWNIGTGIWEEHTHA